MQAAPVHTYEFGDFRLDAAKRLLRRLDGAPVPLTPRVFETLLYLVEHHDTVLDKERIMEAVWPDSIVEENNLSQNISTLRRIFGEAPGSHSYIATIPGRGYRFVAEVKERATDAAPRANAERATTPTSLHDPAEASTAKDRQQARAKTGWLLALAVVSAVVVLCVGALLFWRSGKHESAAVLAVLSEKTIAVLPFKNLSADPDNAYFTDGIQDEILTRLSKIGDLKVISSTSTQKYKSGPSNLREIAGQLGVANILEGGVQKAGDQVRINVQLINAQTDHHLWAESYDRKLTDIFKVESDVAQKIAAALEVRLTGREKREISWVGTKNPQAYEAYLRGLTAGRPFDYDSWQHAVQAFEEAVRADPQFAKAWALLGWLQARIYFQDFDRTEATRIAVGKAVETAMRLDPELVETQMARGFYEYYVVGDYDTARRIFEQVRSRWPNNADIVATLGLIAFRQGRWTEGREYLDYAIALSPRDSFLREEAASTRASARDFPGALRTIDQALAIWPDGANLIAIKATVYQTLGELDQADALLSGLHPGAKDLAALGAICYQAMLRRDPAAAITLLRTLNDSSNSLPPLLQARYHVLSGQLERLSGNANEAHASFTQARQTLEKELERQPQNPLLASLLAQTLAGLGERDAALREADRAVELFPSSRDARDGHTTKR
jgi:TolB-like protein/DNA-binding winged helix-turn-helix (wHTH) protein/Tfp pilus assembly protein PilF